MSNWSGSPAARAHVPQMRSQGRYWAFYALSAWIVFLIALFIDTQLFWLLTAVTVVTGAVMGWHDKRIGMPFARRHYGAVLILVVTVMALPSLIAYSAGYLCGPRVTGAVSTARRRRSTSRSARVNPSLKQIIATDDDPYQAARDYAQYDPNGGGGYLGWDSDQNLATVSPRGALLALGPAGCGKSSAVVKPSVLLAPGACVSSTIKTEIFDDCHQLRARFGQQWLFDPSTSDPDMPDDTTQLRWSPLVGVSTWDGVVVRANSLAFPLRQEATGNGKHFIDNARKLLAVLMYAAVLDQKDMQQVAQWASTLLIEDKDAPGYCREDIGVILFAATERGDQGAAIAGPTYEGFIGMSASELAKYATSLDDILDCYKLLSVRKSSVDTNFDPDEFVRSGDSVYITVPTEHQVALAPVVIALLEAIRFAVYTRDRRIKQKLEPYVPHTTFVLDEATNTAPLPIPKMVSEAGGQGLHMVVAFQSLSQALRLWNDEAKDFLSMFPSKIVFAGVLDKLVTDTLSEAAGEYDRQTESTSRSTSYVNGQWVQTDTPSWSTQRQRVIAPSDISKPPPGHAFTFHGSQPELVEIAMMHSDPVWQRILNPTPPTDAGSTSSGRPSRKRAASRAGVGVTARALRTFGGPSGRIAAAVLTKVSSRR